MDYIVISQSNYIYALFKVIVTFLAVATGIWPYAFFAAFRTYKPQDEVELGNSEMLFKLEVILECIFGLDCFLKFFVEYVDEQH